MKDLSDIYRRLAVHWSDEQLAGQYVSAERDGQNRAESGEAGGPVASLATATPLVAMASVAIHMFHALPSSAGERLPGQLLETAHRNVADGLHRCHRALELDALAHGYSADDWLPMVYEIARPLLESARPDTEPPDVVRAIQEAINWLARAVIELDEDSVEAPTALAEALARLLAVWVFTEIAQDGGASD